MIRVVRSAIIDAPIESVWAVLRDFNSHSAWHPAVGESTIEQDEPSDRIGCVRSFFLKDGNHIREQLLALSDADHVSTYCILDATLPMRRYVATLRLARVTDGERTFWHWESTFDVPKGREAEFDALVGGGVYEGGFAGLRTYLRRGGAAGASSAAGGMREGLGSGNVGRTGAGHSEAHGASLTGQAIQVLAFGAADQLALRTIAASAPKAGEVRIQQTAVGVNYLDVHVRKGHARLIEPPATLGMEAAGIVIDAGPGVAHLLPGDRVAYASPTAGSYASVRTMPADAVVALPDDIDDQTAAALMLKGMTAQYLLHRTCRVRPGDTVLVHAAAGGVGLLLCQWAKALGARVFGTVSTEEKARLARANGCEMPVRIGTGSADYRFADEVLDATGNAGVRIVFDGLGRAAAEDNRRVLARCGHWVSYGQASGALDSVPLATLSEKSLTFSRPVLFDYTQRRQDLEAIAAHTFQACRDGTIRIHVGQRFALADAQMAHRSLEARQTSGSIILLP